VLEQPSNQRPGYSKPPSDQECVDVIGRVEPADGASVQPSDLKTLAANCSLRTLGDMLPFSQNYSRFYNPISVTYDEDRFLVMWHHDVDEGPDWNLRGRIVLPDGMLAGVDNTVRSKLGVGLTGANGKILTVINTGIMSSSADVCARIITRPFVQMTSFGPQSITITFNGVLQSSTNLQSWMDFVPQPASPWLHQIGGSSRFFRVRANTSPNPAP
jgi:hypothetical protein